MMYLRCKRKTLAQSSTVGVMSDTLTTLWTEWHEVMPVDDPFMGHETVIPAQTQTRKRMMFTTTYSNLDVAEGDIAIEMVLIDGSYVESSRQLLVVGVKIGRAHV